MVAGAFGEGAAAALQPRALARRSAADGPEWLTQAQHLALTDATVQGSIRFLEQLLAVSISKATVLLANYPNLFNLETWIPYQLAKPASVTLTIYAVDGRVVQLLALGHQPAGVDKRRSRAEYGDERNAQGESVASGVDFYTLACGDFTATRNLLIRK